KREFVLSKNLLADGTNVGAYVESAQETESRAAFAHEMSIALQKAGRTKFWLNLIHDGRFIDDEEYQKAYVECLEIKRLLGRSSRRPEAYKGAFIGHWLLSIGYLFP